MHWRLQDQLTRHGPKALFLASLGFVSVLAVAGPADTVLGYAEVAPVRVASLEAGRIAEIAVTPGQIVEAGTVVATLDEGPMLGRIRVIQAELSRTGAVLEGQEREANTAATVAAGNRAEAAARLSAARENLRIAQERLDARRAQVTAGLTTRDSLVALEADVATGQGEVRQLSARLGALTEVAAAAADGVAGEKPAVASGIRALGVVQEELALLELRRKELTLRSPLASRVAAVNYRVGEVLPQQTVLAELLPLETTTVVACVPEQYPVRIRAGGQAELWPADGESVRSGTVVDVSGLVSEAPERCKQRPNEVGWVRPVRIEVEGAGLVPGQRFDVAFVPPEETQ
mgnify:CR=1 FL=1